MAYAAPWSSRDDTPKLELKMGRTLWNPTDISTRPQSAHVSGRVLLKEWIESREFYLSAAVAVLTAVAGYWVESRFTHERTLTPLVIGSIEIIFGWIVFGSKRIASEVRDLRDAVLGLNGALANHGEIFKALTDLNDPAVVTAIKQIAGGLSALRGHPQLLAFLQQELAQQAQRIERVAHRGSLETAATYPPQQVQLRFEEYMLNLPRAFRYDTLSNLRFWSTETMMDPAGLLDLNVRVARQKAGKLRRIFVLDREFKDLREEERELLMLHACKSTEHSEYLETAVVPCRAGRPISLDSVNNFGICRGPEPEGPKLLLYMHYVHGKFSRIEAVQDEWLIDRYQREFDGYYGRAISLRDYLTEEAAKLGVMTSGEISSG